MKKILAVLFVGIAFASCSSDDNKSNSNDPVFSQPYTELKSLDELAVGKYTYVGNKIGDRNVGLVNESTQCKNNDYLYVHRNGAVLDSITYNNYRRDIIDNEEQCISIFKFPRLMDNNVLKKVGILETRIQDGYLQEIPRTTSEDEDGKGEVLGEGEVPGEGEAPEEEEVNKEYKRKMHYSGNLEIGFQAGYLRIEDRLSDYTRTKGEKVYLYFKKN
ncbi:hypothetical protein [Myroides fluvii]|uniref:hypothetical protein n=1 Tax=Myroides fluvii TaxID=2572594 RepID=UPI00131C7696|nr:hypothetical protein [Myroides fluvii]